LTRRMLDLNDGVAMVVTDLHGKRSAYDAYLARFRELHAQGAVDRLILCGDLIHSYGPARTDGSLPMILDVIDLQAELGSDTVIMLLGNHELPHLYAFPLRRGATEYTPRFEAALTAAGVDVRARVLDFIAGLPFAVRTAAGVMINHCGASPLAAEPANQAALADFDHQAYLAEIDASIAAADPEVLIAQYQRVYGVAYDQEVRHMLAVTDMADPRYRHLLRLLYFNDNNPTFDLLWDTFYTRNEAGQPPEVYARILRDFLRVWSDGASVMQRVLVSGHIAVNGGYAIIADQQLRMASWAHAHPSDAGVYLRLNCAEPVESPHLLVPHLESVFQ
jgi:hypothetical protein